MKFLNERQLWQIATNHLSDTDCKDFMNLYKKCTLKPYSFLVNDTTLALENFLRFRLNLLERILKLMMLVEKLQKYRHFHQA